MKIEKLRRLPKLSTTDTKRRISAITIILLLAISTVMTIMPAALAQYTKMPDRDTKTEVGVSPTLVGMGQSLLINIMTYPGPNGPTYEAQSLVPLLKGGFANISVTITHPDGSKETFMPIDMTLAQIGIREPGQAQIVGHLQFSYTPEKLGNYSVTASFPGQTYTTDNQHPTIKISVYYKPSASTKPAKFTVQQDIVLSGQLNGYPWSPLPNAFWQDPVNTDNREWAAISGDWPRFGYNEQGTNYNPYSKAPKSPHILWASQVSSSGLPGGEWGSLPYASGVGGSSSIVLDGKIYQNGRSGYFEAIDLYTGKLLWEAAGSINSAQRANLDYQTPAQVNEGAIDEWLWGYMSESRSGTASPFWVRYNPFNGAMIQNITNVPRDLTSIKIENNSPIVWCNQANLNNYNTTKPLKLAYSYLIKWNFSKLITTVGYSQVLSSDWRRGIEWNVSLQTGDIPNIDVGDNNFRGPTAVPYPEANVVVVRTPNAMQVMMGLDYRTGAILWKNNQTVFDIDVRIEGIATSPTGPNMKQDGASNNFVAYDIKTGQEIWRASTGELPWAMLPAYTFVYNNGVFFHGSYDGRVYADSIKDGKRVWVSDFLGEEFEHIYNNHPFNGRAVGADGVLFYSTDTTYRAMPRLRFNRLAAINETTGKFLWVLPIQIAPTAIANGYLVGTDTDNGIQYVIGKGQTKTTVETAFTGISAGTSVLIKGTVLDLSPGAPNTPAISDADMAEWMDYLYGQNATLLNNPPSARGVPVKLLATGSDGSVTEIGTATSDSSGTFIFKWVPTKADVYKITATFEGSESYWRSWAETGLVVDQEHEASTTEPAATVDNMPILYGIAAAAVAIIIAIAVAVVILLKKR